jgi:Putative lumazine-binding
MTYETGEWSPAAGAKWSGSPQQKRRCGSPRSHRTKSHWTPVEIVMSGLQNPIDDEAKIRAAVLDYIAGVLEANPVRMERSLHPDLAKRAYLPGVDGKPQLSHISALTLIRSVKTYPTDRSRRADVVILDRYEGAASVRATFENWVEYMHLVKAGGDWKIINALWELTPERWAAKGGKPRSSEPIHFLGGGTP